MSLGTATPGGGFPVYGEAVATVINETDPSLDVRPRNTKGSTENVPLLEADALDRFGVRSYIPTFFWPWPRHPAAEMSECKT